MKPVPLIRWTCDCGQLLTATPDRAGFSARCPACKKSGRVPDGKPKAEASNPFDEVPLPKYTSPSAASPPPAPPLPAASGGAPPGSVVVMMPHVGSVDPRPVFADPNRISDYMVAAARMKSYAGAFVVLLAVHAVFTLPGLVFIFAAAAIAMIRADPSVPFAIWFGLAAALPGMLANWMYVAEVDRSERIAGEPLPGGIWVRILFSIAVWLFGFAFLVCALGSAIHVADEMHRRAKEEQAARQREAERKQVDAQRRRIEEDERLRVRNAPPQQFRPAQPEQQNPQFPQGLGGGEMADPPRPQFGRNGDDNQQAVKPAPDDGMGVPRRKAPPLPAGPIEVPPYELVKITVVGQHKIVVLLDDRGKSHTVEEGGEVPGGKVTHVNVFKSTADVEMNDGRKLTLKLKQRE